MSAPAITETTTLRPVSVEGLVDALDRVIAGGVAVAGDVIIGVAGIDLIRLDLRLLLAGMAVFEDSVGDDDGGGGGAP